jgi:hypothetical protein
MGVYIKLLETDVWIQKTNIATELAIKENSKKTDKMDKQLVPAEYHKYLDIFSEEKAHRFPELRPWNHKIEMKEGFESKLFKNYNLTPAEQIELDKFLKKNLEKGYIWPSQSPMASLCFQKGQQTSTMPGLPILKRLDGQKLLSFTTHFRNNGQLKGAKYFTKLDMCWDYNNV